MWWGEDRVYEAPSISWLVKLIKVNLSIHVCLLSIIMFSKTKTLNESVFAIISFYLHQEMFILLEFTRIEEVNNSINQIGGSSS